MPRQDIFGKITQMEALFHPRGDCLISLAHRNKVLPVAYRAFFFRLGSALLLKNIRRQINQGQKIKFENPPPPNDCSECSRCSFRETECKKKGKGR